MWFKNLYVFLLEQPWTLSPGELEERLEAQPLRPCSALSMESHGWVEPLGDGRYVPWVDKHMLIALGSEQKLLPSSIVNDEVKRRAAEFEKIRGFKASRKVLRDMKETVTTELLPQAFARRRTVQGWIDPVGNRLIVESSSAARAELFAEQLREALGELPIRPWQADPSPSLTMSGWLTAGQAPTPFVIDQECELAGNDATKPVIRYLRTSLVSPQIRKHLEEGMRVSKLGLFWRDRMNLVVDEQLMIRKLKFLEMEEDGAEDTGLSPEDQFAANFALMTATLSSLLGDLTEVLNIETIQH